MSGISPAAGLLVGAPAHWPVVDLVVQAAAGAGRPPESVDAGEAVIRLSAGGWVTASRDERRAVFTMPVTPSPEALIHPHLAAVAVVQAHWNGWQSFHAGAFVADDGVWGLLGEKEAGKSSMLASLALAGVPVVCDDVLVVSGRTAFAGPRSIDLRAGAAERLQTGVPLGVIGERERWRLPLAPIPAELPFRGWVRLGWGVDVDVRATEGADRLRALLPHRGLRVAPARPEQLIGLAALPVLELRRPREWGSHQRAMDALLRAVTAGGLGAGPGQPGRLQQAE